MKLNIKICVLLTVAVILTDTGCKKLLKEQPRANITPDFFATPGGIEGGVAAAYSDFRNLWGTENFLNTVEGGTDEVLFGGSNNNSYLFTYSALLPGKSTDFSAIWNVCYEVINTLNGVLQFGPSADVDPVKKSQLLAQAKFLRAFCYYHLVISFGDVPLHTTFITEPTTADSRQPIADVYTQIIKDLTEAIVDLPNQPAANTGKPAYKATALYLLAKTYLCRGWSSAAVGTDFTNAYTTAKSIIDNAATYGLGLWPNYNDVNRKGNDYGQETLMVIDHNTDTKYGEYTLGASASGAKENKFNFFYRPNYPTCPINSPASGASIILRDIPNGRPFIRIRPNYTYAMQQAFADKINDSRYDGTFQTIWRSNITPSITTARGTLFPNVDTAIWMPDRHVSDAERAAFKGVIFEPPLPGNINPYTPVFYPSMKKYDDSTRPNLNDASTRPFAIFKFSELYLIAAEAAFKGGGTLQNAADMINVLRQRAAYRPGRPGLTQAQNDAANAAAVVAQTITPAQVTLDFILDERSRELYGEAMRWWDLVRTQSLGRRLQMYNSEASPGFSASSVPNAYALRPIPQTQIDLVTSGPKFPQNPGY